MNWAIDQWLVQQAAVNSNTQRPISLQMKLVWRPGPLQDRTTYWKGRIFCSAKEGESACTWTCHGGHDERMDMPFLDRWARLRYCMTMYDAGSCSLHPTGGSQRGCGRLAAVSPIAISQSDSQAPGELRALLSCDRLLPVYLASLGQSDLPSILPGRAPVRPLPTRAAEAYHCCGRLYCFLCCPGACRALVCRGRGSPHGSDSLRRSLRSNL